MLPVPSPPPNSWEIWGLCLCPAVLSSAITLAPWKGNGLSPEFGKSGSQVLFSCLFLFSPEPIACQAYARCSIYVCWKNKSLQPKVISSFSHTVMLPRSASFLNLRHLKQIIRLLSAWYQNPVFYIHMERKLPGSRFQVYLLLKINN